MSGYGLFRWPEFRGVQENKLTELNLSNNELNQVPTTVSSLSALTVLELQKNKLPNLPPEMKFLSSLVRLDLHENVLEELIEEIVCSKKNGVL